MRSLEALQALMNNPRARLLWNTKEDAVYFDPQVRSYNPYTADSKVHTAHVMQWLKEKTLHVQDELIGGPNGTVRLIRYRDVAQDVLVKMKENSEDVYSLPPGYIGVKDDSTGETLYGLRRDLWEALDDKEIQQRKQAAG